jgi:hypothetical protein
MKPITKFANHTAFVVPLLLAAVLPGCRIGGSKGVSQPATNLLYVADYNNNRVLIYAAQFTTDESASVALGQTNFTNFGNSTTATTMNGPVAVAVDSSGDLFVTDQANCRVLKFPRPFTTGMAASLTLGQADLVSSICQSGTSTATGLGTSPGGIAFDSSGNLWVVDSYFSRILKFPAPFTTGEAATVVLGQATLTGTNGASSGCKPAGVVSASTLCFPGGLAFDSSGNLWVADNADNRVLMYPKANLVNGGAATVELGQPSGTAFTSILANNGGVSATSLSIVFFRMAGIGFDTSGK